MEAGVSLEKLATTKQAAGFRNPEEGIVHFRRPQPSKWEL
jgi:hypothetical protein